MSTARRSRSGEDAGGCWRAWWSRTARGGWWRRLKSALVGALATGAVATINATVWLLASSLSWWRLVVTTIVAVSLAVGWLVIDGGLACSSVRSPSTP